MPNIPPYTWQRPIGLGWDKPYTVRTASNLDDGPWHGMPLGGFGAGCIGRSSRGDFNVWQVDGGEHIYKSIPACQFSVFEQPANSTSQAYALCTQPPEDGSLDTWQWYPSQGRGARDEGREPTTNYQSKIDSTGTYHALYPRSWFVYENVFQTQLTCEQFSPILPENYQESSYPVAVFEWTAHNPTDAPVTISIMLTWQNMVGWFTNAVKSPQVQLRDDGSPVYEYQPKLADSQGNFNQLVEDKDYIGCVLGRVSSNENLEEGEGQWCIATPKSPEVEVTYHTRWNPSGTGEDISEFAQYGSLPNCQNETPADGQEQVAAALAVRFTLQSGETRTVPFSLAWDFPITEFAANVKYYRRYTDFFGRTGKNAIAIALTALQQYQSSTLR